MKAYASKYEGVIIKTGVQTSQLENSLQVLIEKFERALNAMQQIETSAQGDLLNVLAQADAIICSQLYRQYNVLPEQEQPKHSDKGVTVIDKTRVMALKAKALQLKWRNSGGEKISV